MADLDSSLVFSRAVTSIMSSLDPSDLLSVIQSLSSDIVQSMLDSISKSLLPPIALKRSKLRASSASISTIISSVEYLGPVLSSFA